jgi:hypothetical protein
MAGAAAPIALSVARDPATPAGLRLDAAARAARLGLAAPQAYAAVQPIPADLAGADQPGATGEAMLVALARSTGDPSIKETAVMALLKRANDGPEFQALSRLADPSIVQLLSAGAVLRDPALIAMAAAAAGDGASARTARTQMNAPDARKPLPLDLVLLDSLIGAASGQGLDAAVEALDAQYPASDAAGRNRAAAAIALLGALGAQAGPQARLDLASSDAGPPIAPAARLQALQLASSQGRAGDTALYVLQACADLGPTGPAPAARAAMVRALQGAGLKADAQALAIEGLVALQARP